MSNLLLGQIQSDGLLTIEHYTTLKENVSSDKIYNFSWLISYDWVLMDPNNLRAWTGNILKINSTHTYSLTFQLIWFTAEWLMNCGNESLWKHSFISNADHYLAGPI